MSEEAAVKMVAKTAPEEEEEEEEVDETLMM
jgi:hypothetical protein